MDTNRRCLLLAAVTQFRRCKAPRVQVSMTSALVCSEAVQQCPRSDQPCSPVVTYTMPEYPTTRCCPGEGCRVTVESRPLRTVNIDDIRPALLLSPLCYPLVPNVLFHQISRQSVRLMTWRNFMTMFSLTDWHYLHRSGRSLTARDSRTRGLVWRWMMLAAAAAARCHGNTDATAATWLAQRRAFWSRFGNWQLMPSPAVRP